MPKFKKILASFSLIASLIMAGPAWASGGTLSVSPSSGTFNKGCSFTLTISVNTGGAQTDGTDAILFYDSTRFNAVKINNGTAYADYSGSNIDAQNGKITVSGLATGTPFSGSGTLATVDFKVLDDAPAGVTQVKFDFDPNDKAKTTDSNIVEHGTVVDVLSQVQDGSYTVGSGTGCTVTTAQGGPSGGATDSGTLVETKTPVKTLDDVVGNKSGSTEGTVFLAVAGTILTILGIVGLVLL